MFGRLFYDETQYSIRFYNRGGGQGIIEDEQEHKFILMLEQELRMVDSPAITFVIIVVQFSLVRISR